MKTKRIFLSGSLAFCCTLAGWAQDIIVNFQKEAQFTGKDETIAKGYDVSFTFVGDVNKRGANIYGTDSWASVYYLNVSAPRNIAVIEYEVEVTSNKTDDVNVSTGKMNQLGDGTWVWKGSAQSVKFTGGSSSANFRITRLRLWFSENDYNHATAVWDTQGGGGSDGGSTHPYQADVDLANDATDYTKKDRVYASVNVLPTDGHGVPMAVVSDRKFQTTIQPYLEWKTQQGYEVKELYTDQISGGKKGTELAYAIREKLMAMKPRPAYVLLVGDVQEIPSFPGTGPADLFYGEYTDDYYPEAYVGRFSANTDEQLQPQLEKTRYMATLNPKDGEWLKRSLTIDDITSEISVMSPASDLSLYYPRNFDGNFSERTETTWSQSINNFINNGCSYVSYFGHGGPCMWNGNYSVNNVNSLNNSGRYPVVFSITCHAGNFDFSQPCLAESFMQRQDAGAVAVIAASRPSRSDSNYRLFFGDAGGSNFNSAGLLRSLFPCVGIEPSQRARTIGQALEVGMIAVARKIRDDFYENTEMYNLLGDPTYQPYITTPKANKLRPSSNIVTAGRSTVVSTVPDAMVCLSQGRTVIAAAVADADGKVTLHVPATAPTGVCTLYSSAPGYNDVSSTINLKAGNGTEEIKDETIALANITHTDIISVETVGSAISKEWNDQQAIASTTSPARYLICAVNDQSSYADGTTGYRHWYNKNATAEGIFMRNKYDLCSIVTTKSAGKARTVSVDWLHPTGPVEVIGVYGSNSPYNSTEQAWTGGQGKKLGELVKGINNSLSIKDDYAYLLFRAEPSREYGNDEQVNVLFKSISIGWEAALPQCAKPQIAFEGGRFSFRCTTEGATYSYGIVPAPATGKFTLCVTAEAAGYRPSDTATLTIDASELSKVRGDIDGNGTLSISDVVKLIHSITHQNK